MPSAAASSPAVKREPVLLISAIVTLAQTALYVAPAIGLRVPEAATRVATLVLTAAGAFGIRSLVKPA